MVVLLLLILLLSSNEIVEDWVVGDASSMFGANHLLWGNNDGHDQDHEIFGRLMLNRVILDVSYSRGKSSWCVDRYGYLFPSKERQNNSFRFEALFTFKKWINENHFVEFVCRILCNPVRIEHT